MKFGRECEEAPKTYLVLKEEFLDSQIDDVEIDDFIDSYIIPTS